VDTAGECQPADLHTLAATDLTAYPIDAMNSTPFIVDDLSSAFGYVLACHQAPRRPLPRTDSLVSLHRAPTDFSLAVIVRSVCAADVGAAALHRSAADEDVLCIKT
jgi:hypothetical protein